MNMTDCITLHSENKLKYRKCYSCCDGGLLVANGIILPVVSVSALTLFIRYIRYWNLQFLNKDIINKTKVLLPQGEVTLADFCDPV